MPIIQIKISHVAALLRERRNGKGYKQSYVSADIGITQSTYSRIESGEVTLSLEEAAALCTTLDISHADMMQAGLTDRLENWHS